MKLKNVLAMLLFIGMVSSTYIQLNDTNGGNVGDTYVDSSNANTNYGTATTMKAAAPTNPNQTAYMAFYLGGLYYPANAKILDASLGLWKTDTTGVPTTLTCRNTSYFSESTLTWNNKPADLTTQQAISSGTANGEWKYWNVTNGTQAALYNANQTVYLLINNSQYAWDFYTKDNADTAHRPQLVITYVSGPLEPATGLVGYWKLDDNGGTTTYDSSGNNNYGTLVNTPTWTSSFNYQIPYALSFNGVNQYVNVGNSSLFRITSGNDATWSFWIKTTDTRSVDVLGKGEAANAKYWFVRIGSPAPAGYLTSQVYDGTHYALSYSTVTVGDGNWHHVVEIYTASSGEIDFFVDGVNKTTVGNTYANLGYAGIADMTISYGTVAGLYLNGIIDEVKVWNRTLSNPEILSERYHYCPLGLGSSITTFNESSASAIIFNFIASNSTSTFTYDNAYPYWLDYNCNSSFPLGSITVSISNSSFYSPRNYYSTIAYGGSYGLAAYLLPLNDLYASATTIYVKDSSGVSVFGGTVSIYKQVSGVWTLMAQDTTDSIGGTYFNLDSATMYELFANATCCVATSLTLQPTQPVYTITMQTGSTSNQSIFNFSMSGVSWNVTPSSYLVSGTQDFKFSIYNTNNDFEFWGMKVIYNGTVQYTSNQTTSLGGTANYTMNASDTTDNSINVSIFFKRAGGTYFDPTYQYWGHSVSTGNFSLVDAMVRVGDSALSPLTKGILAAVFITCIAGYVGTAVSFSGGVFLELLMLWAFASFGFIPMIPLFMLTLIGGALIYTRSFA